MPRSRLSRRIGILEERLGVRLIQRSTRRFAVTEIGREYYRHCVAMVVEADAAQDVIDRTRSEPQGVVRVSCPSSVIYRSEEHTSELQSLMRISYAVFCLK